MDYYVKQQLRKGAGSIGETAKVLARTFSNANDLLGPKGNIEEFSELFERLIRERIAIHELHRINDGNFYMDKSRNTSKIVYKFLDEIEKTIKANSPAENYVDKSKFCKVDLPTQILYFMLLESDNKRQGFASANDEFATEALKIIYEEVNDVYPFQTFTTKDEFVEDNLFLYRLFLYEIDPSLKTLMQMAKRTN